MISRARLLFLLFFVFDSALARAAPEAKAETLTYLRTAGDDALTSTIVLRATPTGFTVTKRNAQEDLNLACDKDGGTRRWSYTNREHDVRLSGERKGDTIELSGVSDGEPVSATLSIDGDPWFQEAGFSLKEFALSPAGSTTFWMVHPKDLKAHKMKVTKAGRETVQIQGKSVEAVKTEMVIDGLLLSMVWSGYHWHRRSDGMFVKYMGEGGRPGAPDVFVEMTSEPGQQSERGKPSD